MRPTLVYWRRKMGEMDADLDMALSQSLTSSGLTALGGSTMGTHGNVKVEGANNDQFPAGLRVLVVDDDPICLLILDRMLRQCLYKVTTCGTATKALALLRENKDEFDLVISDVCMPDMDGFKLLEHVGLEMDLPVIMMSANGETSAVMKGITHGACDYLLKPVRMEELRNIWQHVVRKKRRESEQSVSHEDEKYKHFLDDCDHHSTGIDGSDGPGKHSKKRKDVKEEDEDVELDNDDSSSTKKPRVVWSVDLHQQFVGAVNQLGIDKAVPKRILELMNVQGLTRENVASHLQKYRLYLKRISGVNHQPVGLNSPFAGAADSSFSVVGAGGLGSLGDVRALAASGQLSPQALVTLQAGLLGRLNSSSNSGITGMDPSLLRQIAALQGVNSGALIRSPYGLNGQGNLHQAVSTGPDLKQLAQGPQQMAAYGPIGSLPDKGSAGISALQQLAVAGGLGSMGQLVGVNNNTLGNPNNNALMMQILQQQAGSQLTNGGGLNVPLGGLLGQHMLSNDIGTRASPLSPASSLSTNTGTGTGVPCAGQLRQGHGSSVELTGSSSPVLGTVGKTSGFDNKSFHLPRPGNVGISLPVVVNVSSTLTSGVSGELCATGMKSLGTSVGGIGENVPQSLRGSGSSFAVTGVNHGPGLNLGSSGHQGWQGLSSRQDLGQASSPVLSPRYSQASSNSQGLNIACGQEQGQVQASGFANQGMVFPGRFGVDSGRMKPARPHSEQSTAESELKVKEGTLDLMVGSKAESGLLPESFSSSDDLLNLFFKQQQQEGFGFTEAELGTDNYGLDNMYVK